MKVSSLYRTLNSCAEILDSLDFHAYNLLFENRVQLAGVSRFYRFNKFVLSHQVFINPNKPQLRLGKSQRRTCQSSHNSS